jgi:hypothetical protein
VEVFARVLLLHLLQPGQQVFTNGMTVLFQATCLQRHLFHTPVLNITTTYYVQLIQSGCTSARTAVIANVIPIQQPSFQYQSGTLCVSGSNATPTIIGGAGGVFSATPTGLVFANTGTGEINAAASALGTYTIKYITGGTCVYGSTVKITITDAPDARFVYNGPFCPQQLTVLPDFSPGANAGIFTSAPGGLLFTSNSTGEIDLQKSTPGTYTLTNTIAASGSCAAAVATGTLVILPQPFVNTGLIKTFVQEPLFHLTEVSVVLQLN